MSKEFINLVDALEKKWDAEIVPYYKQLKQRCLNTRILTKQDTQEIIKELTSQYTKFHTYAMTQFGLISLDQSERLRADKFIDDIVSSWRADIKEFSDIYNRKAVVLRNYFFQKDALRLPMPNLEEQYLSWEIFPSDPETHPQYYTYDFK